MGRRIDCYKSAIIKFCNKKTLSVKNKVNFIKFFCIALFQWDLLFVINPGLNHTKSELFKVST